MFTFAVTWSSLTRLWWRGELWDWLSRWPGFEIFVNGANMPETNWIDIFPFVKNKKLYMFKIQYLLFANRWVNQCIINYSRLLNFSIVGQWPADFYAEPPYDIWYIVVTSPILQNRPIILCATRHPTKPTPVKSSVSLSLGRSLGRWYF